MTGEATTKQSGNRPLQVWCTLLIVLSLALQIGVALVHAGFQATYFDSQRVIGFNEPLTWDLALAMIPHITARKFFEVVTWYPLAGIAFHFLALYLVWRVRLRRGVRQLFFAGQSLLFPLWVVPPLFTLFGAIVLSAPDAEAVSEGIWGIGPASQLWGFICVIILFSDMIQEKLPVQSPSRHHRVPCTQ